MHRFLLLLLAPMLLLASRPARASHAQGGQLTYEALGNNRYRVTLRYFRDCSGIAAEASQTLNCRVGTPTTSCNSSDSRNFTVTLVRGLLTTGAPYCPSVPGANTCTSGSLYPNYETAKYTADITLPPAPEWTLSVEISARPSIENIGGQSNMRYEATLNNQIALAGGTQQTIQNTSPQYQDQDTPVPFVGWQQQSTITFSTFEPDGDSLVYALDRPLEGCNQFSTYLPINNGAPLTIIPDPANPGCVAIPVGIPTTYSPTFPLVSLQLTGSCPVKTATPFFLFDPFVGSVTFNPVVYDATSPSSAGKNKYAVVGKVTEYRKLNGQYYKVGSVRRDMLVVVIDCGPNALPTRPTTSAGDPSTGTDVLTVSTTAGVYQEANFYFSDPNPSDVLTVSIVAPNDPAYQDMYVNPAAPALPVTVLNNGTATPSLKVRLRPDPYLAGRTFFIPVKVEDNACPIKGAQYYVLSVKVDRPGTATATQAAAKRTMLSAYPTPFTEQVRFTLPRPKAGAAAVLIFDQLGRLVDQLPVPASATPETTLTWTPAATVPAGVYSARFADGQHTARLVRVAP